MKTLTTIILLSLTSLGSGTVEKNENCFSETNFDTVYQYIDAQIKESDESFYQHGKYELWLSDASEISLKKEGYTLSKIVRKKGIFSLAKSKKPNAKSTQKTHRIFCELLLMVEKGG